MFPPCNGSNKAGNIMRAPGAIGAVQAEPENGKGKLFERFFFFRRAGAIRVLPGTAAGAAVPAASATGFSGHGFVHAPEHVHPGQNNNDHCDDGIHGRSLLPCLVAGQGIQQPLQVGLVVVQHGPDVRFARNGKRIEHQNTRPGTFDGRGNVHTRVPDTDYHTDMVVGQCPFQFSHVLIGPAVFGPAPFFRLARKPFSTVCRITVCN